MLDILAKEKGFVLSEENGFDDLGRPCIDLYYMNLCFGVNLRSIDKSSKCGCIAAHKDGAFLSSGYNNPLRGSDDHNIPDVRPDKYAYMEHSERNAIYNAARHGIKIYGSTFYITGFPCIDCLRGMVQSGAKKIIYGPLQVKMPEIREDALYSGVLKKQTIVIKRFVYDEGLFFLNPIAKFMVDLKKEAGIPDVKFEWNVPRLLNNKRGF